MNICSIFCIYIFELLSVYYKYNLLGLLEHILCFYDELSIINFQGECNNSNDFVTVVRVYKFYKSDFLFCKGTTC